MKFNGNLILSSARKEKNSSFVLSWVLWRTGEDVAEWLD